MPGRMDDDREDFVRLKQHRDLSLGDRTAFVVFDPWPVGIAVQVLDDLLRSELLETGGGEQLLDGGQQLHAEALLVAFRLREPSRSLARLLWPTAGR